MNVLSLMLMSLLISALNAGVVVDQPIKPMNFGEDKSLKDYQGKLIVLEWFNPTCPYVKKHYEAETIPQMIKDYVKQGVVWLAVDSTSEKVKKRQKEQTLPKMFQVKGRAGIIQDSSGEIGKQFGALTTPHMFIVDYRGKEPILRFKGAIDNTEGNSFFKKSLKELKAAKSSFRAGLERLLANKMPEVKKMPSYGCSVKYAH